MVTKAEMHKKMIKTVITQLPQYIRQYSSSDQVLLKDFIETLQYFEQAERNRANLINQLVSYSQYLYRTDEYIHTAFLWFSENYFQKAGLILSLSNFQAENYYKYLAKYLRTGKNTVGVFELIRKGVPLTDIAWEQLQLESNQLLIPLNKEKIKIINAVNSTIQHEGILSLDSKRIISALVKKNSSNPISINKTMKLFDLLEGRWILTFHSIAFGISRVFFHIKLKEAKQINEIINFQNENGSILNQSTVYRVQNSLKAFLGILYVPSGNLKQLFSLFSNYEKKKLLTIKKLFEIKTSHRSVSLKCYKAGSGWDKTKKSTLTSKNDLNSQICITQPFNQKWLFKNHPLPSQIIKLYCDIPYEYSFSNLPLSKQNRKKHLSNAELGLLKQLSYNNVIQIIFVPWRLVYEFSLDPYWITLPYTPLDELKQYLSLFPYCEANFSEENSLLMVYLTQEQFNWFNTKEKWEVFPISLDYYYPTPKYSWFDEGTQRWKIPEILKKKEKG